MRYIFTMLSIIFYGVSLLAQSTTAPLYLHHHKPWYVAGDNLWYQVYGANIVDDVVYVQLIHAPTGRLVADQQLRVSQQKALEGVFSLPDSLQEGNYYLAIATPLQLQSSPPAISYCKIAIYEPRTYASTKKTTSSTKATTIPQDWSIKRQNDTLSVTVNEQIELPVVSGENTVQYFSVGFHQMSLTMNPNVNELAPRGSINTTDYVPKERSTLYLSVEGENENLKSRLATFIPDMEVRINAERLNNGAYTCVLPPFQGYKILQIPELLSIDQKEGKIQFSAYCTSPFALGIDKSIPERTLEIEQEISNLILDRQLLNLFNSPTQAFTSINTKPALTLTPEKSFFLEEYIPFSGLEEFVEEAVNFAKYRVMSDGREHMVFINKMNSKIFTSPPLFMVNGYLVDEKYATQELDWRWVKQIDCFRDTRTLAVLLGPVAQYGLVSLITDNPQPPKVGVKGSHTLLINGWHTHNPYNEVHPAMVNAKVPKTSSFGLWKTGEIKVNQKSISIQAPNKPGLWFAELATMDQLGKMNIRVYPILVQKERISR